MKSQKNKLGGIIVHSRGQHKVFTVIVKTKHDDELKEPLLIEMIKKLKRMLTKDSIELFRIARFGDLIEELEPIRLDSLVEVFCRKISKLNCVMERQLFPLRNVETR